MKAEHDISSKNLPINRTNNARMTTSPSSSSSASNIDRTWLALHQACRDDAALDRIQELVKVQPSALQHWATPPPTDNAEDQSELRLPLHVACEYGASLKTIQFLVQQDPSTLQATAVTKMYTALDFALYHFHSLPKDDENKTQAEAAVHFLAQAERHHNKRQQQQQPKKQAVFRRKSKSSKIIRIRLPTTTTSRLDHHHHHPSSTLRNSQTRLMR